MANPVLVETTRGGIVESRHRGAYAIVSANGELLDFAGDITTPVYPRSAIKALQALPLVESGAAKKFGLSAAEIALACSSHNGEGAHVAGALSVLEKAGCSQAALACGSQWPRDNHALLLSGGKPRDVHNNCSGKHAGMIACAAHKGFALDDYWKIGHPLQQTVMRVISQMCDYDLSQANWGFDGCSLPSWAIPLSNVALGFSRLASGNGLSEERKQAAQTIIAAVRENPFMVAGSNRFCTRLMQAVPRAFVKTGAEGVFCAAIPHTGVGIALKVDDGNHRASEPAIAAVLAGLDGWSKEERETLKSFATVSLHNRRNIEVGEVRAVV